MLVLKPTRPSLVERAVAAPAPSDVRIVRPQVTVRPARPDEQIGAEVWRWVAAPGVEIAEVAEFGDGSMTHAPEVIEEYRAQAAMLPAGFLLIYLHRGVQAQCVNPLLPSLLHMAGHDGPSHALRRDGRDGLSPDVIRFARAMTPAGGAALIVDDRQLRLGAPGRITPAEVRFHQFLKPGLARKPALGANQ